MTITSPRTVACLARLPRRMRLSPVAGGGGILRRTVLSSGAPALWPNSTMAPSQPLGPVSGMRAYSQDAAQNKTWSFEEVLKLTQEPRDEVVIVDVREPNELQDTGRIPGAVNIPITSLPDSFHVTDEEFEDRLGYPRPPKDFELVVYCKSGVRSRSAAALARHAGWDSVGEYPGSWLDWAAKGGPTQK